MRLLDLHRLHEPGLVPQWRPRLIQVMYSFTGSQILGRLSVSSYRLMARTWEAIPKAETTVATYRQASTALQSGPILIAPEPVRGKKP
jgi:hypothetical protein